MRVRRGLQLLYGMCGREVPRGGAPGSVAECDPGGLARQPSHDLLPMRAPDKHYSAVFSASQISCFRQVLVMNEYFSEVSENG